MPDQAPQTTPTLAQGPPTVDRKKTLCKAMIAGEAERYDHVTLFMKEIIATTNENAELTRKEGCLLASAYKNLIIYARTALGAATAASRTWLNPESKKSIAVHYFDRCKAEITQTCIEFLELIERRLLPTSRSTEMSVYYLTLKGEFNWYLAESTANRIPGMHEELEAKSAYSRAWEQTKNLDAMNPFVLALAFSYAEFHSEFLGNPSEAHQIIERTVKVVSTLEEEGKRVHPLLSFHGGLQLSVKLMQLQRILPSNAAGASNIPVGQEAGPSNIQAGNVAGPSNIPAGNLAGPSNIPQAGDAAGPSIIPSKCLAAAAGILGKHRTKRSNFLANYINGASNPPASLVNLSGNVPVGGAAGPSSAPVAYATGPSNIPTRLSNIPMNYQVGPSSAPTAHATGPSNIPIRPFNFPMNYQVGPSGAPVGPSNIPIKPSNIPMNYQVRPSSAPVGPSNIPITPSNIPMKYAVRPASVPTDPSNILIRPSNIPMTHAVGPSSAPTVPSNIPIRPSNIPKNYATETSSVPAAAAADHAAGSSSVPGPSNIPIMNEEEGSDLVDEYLVNPSEIQFLEAPETYSIPGSRAAESSTIPASNVAGVANNPVSELDDPFKLMDPEELDAILR